MRGRLLAIGFGLGSMVALGLSSIVPACYSPPEPACGFTCGPNGACPDDYSCLSGRCVLAGASCGAVDASVLRDVSIDTPVDAFSPDVGDTGSPIIDSPIEDAAIDAAPTPDAMVDAMPDADAMVDAAPAADAMVDAAPTPDAMADAAALPDAAIDAGVMDDAAPPTD